MGLLDMLMGIKVVDDIYKQKNLTAEEEVQALIFLDQQIKNEKGSNNRNKRK